MPDVATRPFTLMFAGTSTSADSLTDLIGCLPGLDGYPDLDDDAALRARWEFCVATANQMQMLVLQATGPTGLSDMELSAVCADRLRGVPWPVGAAWTAQVPLFVVATDHEPFTGVPVPAGDAVRVLDPSDEARFVDSLVRVGLVSVEVGEDADD